MTTKTSEKGGQFEGYSLGYRLYAAVEQYIKDIDGEELPSWWNLSPSEKGAWEAQAITETMGVLEPDAFLNATYKVAGLD